MILKTLTYTQRFLVFVGWVFWEWVNIVAASVFASFRRLVWKAVELFLILSSTYVPRNRIVMLVCISVLGTCCFEAEQFSFLPWMHNHYPKNCSVKRVDSVYEDGKPWGNAGLSAGNKQQTLGSKSPLRNRTACLWLVLGLKSGVLGLPSWARFMVGPE